MRERASTLAETNVCDAGCPLGLCFVLHSDFDIRSLSRLHVSIRVWGIPEGEGMNFASYTEHAPMREWRETQMKEAHIMTCASVHQHSQKQTFVTRDAPLGLCLVLLFTRKHEEAQCSCRCPATSKSALTRQHVSIRVWGIF